MSLTDWRMQGTEIVTCSCDVCCPCQFSRLPTHGQCSAAMFLQVDRGRFGDVSLDGLLWAVLVAWPGPIHKGNGTMQVVVDERASVEQRTAAEAVAHGKASEPGKLSWSIYSAMTSTFLPTLSKPMDIHIDCNSRIASVRIPGVVETTVGPLRNIVTGDPHRASLHLPDGFEFSAAEIAMGRTKATGEIPLDLTDTHAHLARFHWGPRGVIR